MEYRHGRQVASALAQYRFLYALAWNEFYSAALDMLTLLVQYGPFEKADVSKEVEPVYSGRFSPGDTVNIRVFVPGVNPVKYTDPDGKIAQSYKTSYSFMFVMLNST